jgi:PAS domain-containing protein
VVQNFEPLPKKNFLLQIFTFASTVSPHLCMKIYTVENFYDEVTREVMECLDICVAIDEHLAYIALNEVACQYLGIEAEDLIGISAIEKFPEIIASRYHRNMLRALSGEMIESDLVESRVGDVLRTSYTPVLAGTEVKAVILRATVHSSGS